MPGGYEGAERRREPWGLKEFTGSAKLVSTAILAALALLVAMGARYEFVGQRVTSLEANDKRQNVILDSMQTQLDNIQIMGCLQTQNDPNVRNIARLGCSTLLQRAGIEVRP